MSVYLCIFFWNALYFSKLQDNVYNYAQDIIIKI